MPASAGQQTAELAEALDLYRTLAGLTGFSADAIEPGVEGTDLSPVFNDPSTIVKDAAFSQMARCPAVGTLGPESACNTVPLLKIPYMGFTVRVDAWRYTAWLAFDGATNTAGWDDPRALIGEELYAHANDTGVDFDAFENVNVVTENTVVRDELMQRLRARFAVNTTTTVSES